MAIVRRRTLPEVVGLLEMIAQDVERVLPQEPTTYREWRLAGGDALECAGPAAARGARAGAAYSGGA